jgi:hypothetical protein
MQTSVRRLAHTRPKQSFFPGMGHNMMLESGWYAVALRMHEWLDSLDL